MARDTLRTPKRAITAMVALGLMALALAACAPQPGSGTSGSASLPSTWSADVDCTLCHTVEKASLSDSSCPASSHAALPCTTCHTQVDALAARHTDMSGTAPLPTRLKKTEVDQATCLTCHGSYEDLARKSAGVTLADEKGTEVNPHGLPASEQHSTIQCFDCHKMHKGGNPTESALTTCKSCHHEGVFECGTCHSV